MIGRGFIAKSGLCPHCGHHHGNPCPSPEEIWGVRGGDGEMRGGLVNEARALASRRQAGPDAVPVPALDERLVITDDLGLPVAR